MQRPKNERVWCLGELPVVYYGMSSIGRAGNSVRYDWRNNLRTPFKLVSHAVEFRLMLGVLGIQGHF